MNFISSNWKNVNMSSNLLESKEFCGFPSSPLIPFFFLFLVCPIATKVELVLDFVVKSSSIDVMGIQAKPIAYFPFLSCGFPLSFLFFYLSSAHISKLFFWTHLSFLQANPSMFWTSSSLFCVWFIVPYWFIITTLN